MAVLRLAHFEVATSVAFTLLVVYVASAYLTALQLSRKDSFLLELRVPDLQVTEAILITIILLLMTWNQTLQDVGVPISCFYSKLASVLIVTVLQGSFIFRAVRVKVLSHSKRRKRYGKYMSPRAMRVFMVLMALYGVGLLVLLQCFNFCGSDLCRSRRECTPFADWYLMGPQVLALVSVLLFLGVTESNTSVQDPLQFNLENRQVGTVACLGAGFSFCFIALIDIGVVRGTGARVLGLLNSIVVIIVCVFIFIFSGLLPAMRFGYSPFPGLGRSLHIGVEHARALKEQKTLANIRLVAKSPKGANRCGCLGRRGESTKGSILPAFPTEEPTSKRYVSLRDELFQVLSEKETRLLFFDFCARIMCEEHAQFVYEYRRLMSEHTLSSTKRHVSLRRMLKLIKDYVARDGMYAMGMSVQLSQSLTHHAATLSSTAQHKPSEPRLLEVQDALYELFVFVLCKLVNSTFVEFREYPPYVGYLTTLAIAARRRNREAANDSGRHQFYSTSEMRPSDMDKTMLGVDDADSVVNMAQAAEEGFAAAGGRRSSSNRDSGTRESGSKQEASKQEASRQEASKQQEVSKQEAQALKQEPSKEDPRTAKVRQNELLLHLAQSGKLLRGFQRSLRRMDSDIQAQLNAPRDAPSQGSADLLTYVDISAAKGFDMMNSWRTGAAKARRISTSEQDSFEGRGSTDW